MEKRAWKAWLEAGAPLTELSRARIIAEVCAKHPDRTEAIRRILSRVKPREPGEEG